MDLWVLVAILTVRQYRQTGTMNIVLFILSYSSSAFCDITARLSFLLLSFVFEEDLHAAAAAAVVVLSPARSLDDALVSTTAALVLPLLL